MTTEAASFRERQALPPILWPEDLAVVLGLPSERSARDFLLEHGVPHCRIGKRIFVLAETLLDFLKTKETRRATRAELRAKADATIQAIAPPASQRRRGRKPPCPRRD